MPAKKKTTKKVAAKKTSTKRTHHTMTSHMHPNTFLLVVAGGAFVIISIIYLMM